MSFSSGSHLYLSLFIYISSLTFLFQSPMQVDDTGGPPAPNTSPPMLPPTSSAPAAGAISIPHFLVSLFSRSFLLFLTLIYFLSLLLHLCSLLALTVVLLRKICFSFFSLFFFLTCFFIACAIFHTTQDFYKQGICTQNSMLRSCFLPTIKVALIFASSNVLQAIYSLENAARNYKDATEEQDCLSSLYDSHLSAQSAR